MMMGGDKAPMPVDVNEEPISHIYNPRTQTVHKWPGCYAVERSVRRLPGWLFEYWSTSEYRAAKFEHGVIHRCRVCFGKPRP